MKLLSDVRKLTDLFKRMRFKAYSNTEFQAETNASVNSTCPQPPSPRVTAGHLPALSVRGVGHLQILHCPGAGHLPTPGPYPRF